MQNHPLDIRRLLLASLMRYKNGVVADAQAALGAGSRGYGVSLPTIRQCAAAYAPDHAFAGALFGDTVRELRLAAAYIDDPAQVTSEQMNDWKSRFGTFEVAVNCASALFWKAPDGYAVALQWLDGETDPVVLRAAAVVVAKSIAGNVVVPDEATVAKLLPLLAKNMFAKNVIVTDGIAGILEWLVRKNNANRKTVARFLEKQKAEGNPAASEILAQQAYW